MWKTYIGKKGNRWELWEPKEFLKAEKWAKN